MARTEATTVIAQCESQVGYREGYNNYNKYASIAGHANYEAWCATFLVAEFKLAGQELPSGTKTAGCYENCRAFKNAGRFSYYPAVGAIFFIGPSGSTHTGLVYWYDNTYVYTIEGNTNEGGSANGNGVYRRKRLRRDIYGYGYPNYSHPIKSADPKWGGTTNPGTPPTPPTPTLPVVEVYNVQPGRSNSDVLLVQKALKMVYPSFDYTSGPGIFGPRTTFVYAQWQRDCGVGEPYDGEPGITSLTRLADRSKLFKASN